MGDHLSAKAELLRLRVLLLRPRGYEEDKFSLSVFDS